MISLYRFFTIISFIFIFTANQGIAQTFDPEADLTTKLKELAEDNAKGYMQPFATALGTAINSGLYHTAKIHRIPGFDFGLRAMVVDVPTEGLTYTSALETESSTVFGAKDSADPLLPGGLDKTRVPFVVAQVTIGLFMGTEINIRYLPEIEISDDIGKIDLTGFGLSHSIDQYMPVPLPLLPKLSVGYMRQEFNVGDILTSTHTAFNIRLSKSVPLLTVYLGAQIESTDMDLTYTENITKTEVNVSLEGDNSFRYTGGLRLSIFPLIGINADYSAGEYNAVNIGLTFSFDPPGIPII